MPKLPFKSPALVKAIWGLALAIVFAFTLACNVALHRHVAALRERDPGFHWAAADSRVRRNDFIGAFEELEVALALAPERYEPHQIAGNLHYRLQHWQEAFDAYQRAVQHGCPDGDVRLRSVLALLRMKRYENAAELGKTYIAQGQTYPGFARYVGEACRHLEKQAEAIPLLETALEQNPSDVLLMEELRRAYAALGQTQKAEAVQSRIDATRVRLESLR
ncbi:MAG TPA: tetratricopeptide repeat protein [Candidatus Hydrogenedentes bacterium]|nr:tetratricopeptide repeat protein [Candidatus Hydrogenedentota bacterium]HIJ74625.1 tetratricopeptide repeat protein [Candidatus Hydrogenedentota bacterium]